jgi:hypothetical protein
MPLDIREKFINPEMTTDAELSAVESNLQGQIDDLVALIPDPSLQSQIDDILLKLPDPELKFVNNKNYISR